MKGAPLCRESAQFEEVNIVKMCDKKKNPPNVVTLLKNVYVLGSVMNVRLGDGNYIVKNIFNIVKLVSAGDRVVYKR